MHSAAQVVCVGNDEATLRRRAAAIGRDARRAARERPRRVAAERSSTGSAPSPRSAPSALYLQVLDLSDLDHLADVREALAGPA